jgi:ABC-type amino acid transport system permease subunit
MTTTRAANTHEPDEEVRSQGRKGPMEGIIETLANGLGNGVGWMAENGVLFAAFAILWIAFGAGLLVSQGSIDQTWQAIRGLPLIIQLVAWLLFLPVMLGMWVWETTWPFVIRLMLVISIAGWNLLVFLPKAMQVARP